VTDDLNLVPLTGEHLLGLLDDPDGPAGRAARQKLEAWRPDEFGTGLWVRVGQIWRRPNGREFMVLAINGDLARPRVDTKPLSEGGRPSSTSAWTLSTGVPDPAISPRLVSTPPPAEWVLVARDLSKPKTKMDQLIEVCGPRLCGVRPGRGHVQFELSDMDAGLEAEVLAMTDLDLVLSQRA